MHTTDHDWVSTPVTADLLRGALDLERTAHGLLPHRRMGERFAELAFAADGPFAGGVALTDRGA